MTNFFFQIAIYNKNFYHSYRTLNKLNQIFHLLKDCYIPTKNESI